MKYIPPKAGKTNHNISQIHPLRELLRLLATIAVSLFLVWLVLGWSANFLAPYAPRALEERIAQQFITVFGDEMSTHPEQERLQKLADELGALTGDTERKYTVHIVDSDSENAMSLPNGHIVILNQLLKQAKSENEIAMVIGHEIGHDFHRDHMRGLGRGIGTLVLSALIFGSESSVSDFFLSSVGLAQASFSREQEREADRVGLDLLMQRYGHAGGATSFFERLLSKDHLFGGLKRFQATHPSSRDRIRAIESRITSEHLPVDKVIPWGKAEKKERKKSSNRDPFLPQVP
ncbi:MAG: M48 family metallopeptidase [Bdellovibrionales bacterium]|nr:M48 family metallopeptidase [Bdellovibrionales bacterium]